MTLPTQPTCEPGKIEAYKVSAHARLGTLPRHFGRHMITVEGCIYDFMRQFSREYKGGEWSLYELSNGGFLMTPPEVFYGLRIPSNGYTGEMSAQAAGITVCLFSFSHLSFQYPNTEVFSRHYHWLRDFALDHAESGQIFATID